MEKPSSRNDELVPRSVEELEEIVQKYSETGNILMPTWNDSELQDIPGSENCLRVNLSSLLASNEPHTDSTDFMWRSRKFVPDELKKKKEQLQETVGPHPKIIIEDFKNWAKTQTAQVLAARPETLDQLKKLIYAAGVLKLKIRCAGAKHSWASLFADSEQMLIYMEKMNSDYPDKSKIYHKTNQDNTVDVHIMAGVSNEEFKQFQLDNNVNIPANVILTIVQVASVIVTGCHGVGMDCKCPCDYVVQMRIVDSNGELQTYTRETHGEEMMKAAIANFGLFGVVYDMAIRLECKPTFVKTINDYISVKDIFYTEGVLEDLVKKNWSVELFWFPMNKWTFPFCWYDLQNDDVWVRLINKDDEGANHLPDDTYYEDQEIWDKYTAKIYSRLQDWFKVNNMFHFLQASACSVMKYFIYPTKNDLFEKLPEAVHFRKYIENVPVYDMEFAFDLSEQKNYDLIRQATQIVFNEVEREYKNGRYPLNVAMEMRYMSHSDGFLCPASIVKDKKSKDPKVVYIEILSLEGTEGWEEFFLVIGKKWMEMGGVPHLAKQWEFLPDIHRHIRQKFGDRIDSFKEQLQLSGADSNRMFMNEGLRKLLYPE